MASALVADDCPGRAQGWRGGGASALVPAGKAHSYKGTLNLVLVPSTSYHFTQGLLVGLASNFTAWWL